MSGRQQRTMVSPINVIFKYLQSAQPVSIWLYDVRYTVKWTWGGGQQLMVAQILDFRLEGKIVGFDEFMNVVLDDAYEVWVKAPKGDGSAANGKVKKEYGSRTALGRLLLKGENITLISPAQKSTAGSGLVGTQAMEH